MGAAAGALEPLKKLGASFGSSTAAQKVVAVVAVVALVAGGVLFWRWASAPTMTPLFSNLAMADAGAITEQLDSTGTPYELADGGSTVLVPRDMVYDLRLDMSAAGLPGDAGTGYALLDEQGVTASQFQQRTTWQRALEGELATTIGSIASVESARVQLAIPEDDVFADTAGTPTASVLVTTRPGQELTGGQVQSVLNLVSSSVEGMKPEDVTIVDAAGTLLSAAGAGGAAGGMRDQQTTDYESRVQGDLQQVLDRVVGPGKAVATVTADLDFDDVRSTEEVFTNPEGGPLALAESGSEEEYTGASGALVGGQLGGTGIFGPDNIAVPTQQTQGVDGVDAGGYTNSSTDRTNGVNKTTTQTQAAPGGVRRQSVSVVVDTEASRTIDLQQLQDAVSAAAGIDAARGDVLSVSQMPFDTAGADAAAEAAAAADAAEAAEARTALIQTVAVLAVVLLLLVVAAIAALRRRKKQQVEEEPLDLGPMEPVPAPPPPPTEAIVAVPAPRPALEEAVKPPAAVAREQVVELAESSPDDVAELLRGWLTADKR